MQTKASIIEHELELENRKYEQAIKNDKEFSEAKKIRCKISLLELESASVKEKLLQKQA